MLLNLNADLGESFGNWSMGDDQNLLQVVDSANVACGFHAGDPLVMTRTIENAETCRVSVGAHPGFPDLQGFGRRPMKMSASEIRALIIYQLAALAGVSECYNSAMTHVKPHGALNNMACEDADLAQIITQAVHDFDQNLILLAPVLSELAFAASRTGLTVALEIFADRAYTERGTLVARSQTGAVLSNTDECIRHVRTMISEGGVVAINKQVLKTEFHSICVHGDNAHAVDTAREIRKALQSDGHELLPLPKLMARL
jgi:UPF0271 protein